MGERPRERDPLLLAAGQPGGATRALSVRPRSSSSSSRRLRACRADTPDKIAGSSTLSATVIVDSRLAVWNT